MRGLFLVGTDTGVGKTTVGIGLVRLAARRGSRLVPFKPVETGCDPNPRDARLLRNAANIPDLAVSDICPFPFPAPVAPSVAARLAGSSVSTEALLARAHALVNHGDALLIEGAGGLLTPYGPEITAASLADLFDIPILLVAANRLGTINHVALSVAEIRRRRLRLAGIILVDVSATQQPDHAFNSHEINAITGIAPLGTLRHCPSGDPDGIADALASDILLGSLLDGILA